jgi:hypothetical protein
VLGLNPQGWPERLVGEEYIRGIGKKPEDEAEQDGPHHGRRQDSEESVLQGRQDKPAVWALDPRVEIRERRRK